jgi:hypothetical protein
MERSAAAVAGNVSYIFDINNGGGGAIVTQSLPVQNGVMQSAPVASPGEVLSSIHAMTSGPAGIAVNQMGANGGMSHMTASAAATVLSPDENYCLRYVTCPKGCFCSSSCLLCRQLWCISIVNNAFCPSRWNEYEKKYAETFRVLRDDEYFSDVTLATEGHSVKAHRVILSACSNYFHAILKTMSPWQHPVLVLQDVKSADLNSLMDFIYFGQVRISRVQKGFCCSY